MKTRLYTLLGLLALSATATAQSPIILNNAGYPTTFPVTDNAKEGSNMAAFPTLGTAGNNQSWDLGTVTYSGNSYYDRFTPTNSAFAGATYRAGLFTTFAGGLQYVTSGYYTLSTAGLQRIGEEVRVRQALSIGAVTGNNADSVIFPIQTISYTGGSTPDLVFPATNGSNWSSSVGSTLNFNLTVTSQSLNNVPGQRRILRTANDTVVGWGRMRVMNDATGLPSGWMNVLQVRSRVAIRDSFYLGGSPAPATLLVPFGLSQGQITNVTYVKFYRASEYSPLVELTYNALNSTGAPSRMIVSQMRLASPTSVGGVDAAEDVRLFPNPVRGGAVSVKLPAGQSFRYQIISVTGAVTAEGTLKASNAGEASVVLPASATTGIYYLTLYNERTGRLVLPFDVVR